MPPFISPTWQQAQCAKMDQGDVTGEDLRMKPDEVIWALEPHTAAKHTLLREYLHAWIPILGRREHKLILIDGFAGPGIYEGGEPGSPIIMLRAYLEHAARASMPALELVYVLIEKEAERLQELRRQIAVLNLPSNVRVVYRHGLFDTEMGVLLDSIPPRFRLAPTFAFIDPFGYTGHGLRLSSRILGFPKCEVLIYIPLPFIARFVKEQSVEPALDNLFGDASWRRARDAGDGRARERLLHDAFLERLQGVAGLARSFEIDAAGGWSGYHLFFGTHNKTGLRAMKDAMWSIDPVGGNRFADSTNPGQLTLFEAEPDLGPLLAELRASFGTRSFTIEDAEDYTLLHTPYSPTKHLKKKVLAPAELRGDLEAMHPGKKRKVRTYPPGTVLRFRTAPTSPGTEAAHPRSARRARARRPSGSGRPTA